jgi:hypothetical protein
MGEAEKLLFVLHVNLIVNFFSMRETVELPICRACPLSDASAIWLSFFRLEYFYNKNVSGLGRER